MIEAWEAMLDGMSSEGEKRRKAARELAAKRVFGLCRLPRWPALPQVIEPMRVVENKNCTPNPALATAMLGVINTGYHPSEGAMLGRD
jgi:hypothetical protein